MRIHLIAVGNKMPQWVQEGFAEYASRMPRECTLQLHEINPGKRTKSADLNKIRLDEGERILAAIPAGSRVIVLDVQGKAWSTEQLSHNMENWLQSGQDIALLVGGPEGLSNACIERADQRWSLSALTLPHPMVRVLLAEQLYRAWTIIQNHPYHR